VVTIYTGPATTYLQWLLGNYTITQTRINLLPNPNIELGTSTYIARNGATIARTTSEAYIGSASLQFTTSASVNNGTTIQPNIAITAGVTYTFSCYAKTQTGTYPNFFASIIFRNAGGTEVGRVTGPSTILTTSWGRLTASLTAPVGSTQAECFVVRNTALAGIIWFADAFVLEATSTVLPYFDGTYVDAYTDYTLTYQAWNGVADASSSTTVWGLNSSGTGSPLNDSTYGLD
jgi:hypothetical protein